MRKVLNVACIKVKVKVQKLIQLINHVNERKEKMNVYLEYLFLYILSEFSIGQEMFFFLSLFRSCFFFIFFLSLKLLLVTFLSLLVRFLFSKIYKETNIL